MKRKIFQIVLLLWYFFFTNPAYSQQTKLVIVSPGPGHPMMTVATKILSEAYDKIGYQAEFRHLPPLRAIAMFQESKADSYLFASELFLKDCPAAIRVLPSIGYDEIMAFSRKSSDVTVNGWNSIRPYSIGLMKGMDVVENRVKGMQTYGTENLDQAFKMLEKGRFDIVVLPRLIGCQFIVDYTGIEMLEPPLEKVALYTFLNAEHKDIADKLSVALLEMYENGRVKAITEQVLTQELQECSNY